MRTYYPSINGLRAISIIMVTIGHLSLHNNIIGPLDNYHSLVRPLLLLISDAHLGVSVFFVVSGFLITKILLEDFRENNSINLRSFYLKRILRIFPAYYTLLLFYFILQAIGTINLASWSWISSLTFTKYFNWSLDWETAHLWSLSVEEHFYFVWPLILYLGIKHAKRAAFGAVILVAFFRIYYSYFSPDWINTFTIFIRADAIAIGCLFAFYEKTILRIISKQWQIAFISSTLFLISFPYFCSWLKPFWVGKIFKILGEGNISLPSYIAVGFLLFYSIHGPKSLWHRFLNFPILNFIGILSYGIYLWQQFFISGNDGWIFTFPYNIILIGLVSTASYYLIEKPFLNLKNKIGKN